MRGFRAARYIFSEIVPGLILGTMVFLLLMVVFQGLRLTEFVLIHGVSLKVVGQILGYQCISFMPVILPMALLFAVLLGYGRLSGDSEIVAMKAAGLSMWSLSVPAITIGLLVAIVSAQTSFYIAPWGNRQFEVLLSKFGSSKASIVIKEGTFSEGFFDLVVYAGKIEPKTGVMESIFLYDERNESSPLTIVAKKGQIIPDEKHPGHSVLLRLLDGDIHRQAETHTKIKFDVYDIQLADPIKVEQRDKSPQSLSVDEIFSTLESPYITPEESITLRSEFYKRAAISLACLIFAILGVALGAITNRRSARSNGVILCFIIIIVYWILYVSFEGLARTGKYPVGPTIWIPNILFGLYSAYSLRKNWD